MKNRKPITTKWYVKLIIVIFCAGVLIMLGKSFWEGFKEGRQMKLDYMKKHQK